MSSYDPNHAPSPAHWLAMDEAARLEAILLHHSEGRDTLHPSGQSPRMHAGMHQAIETQLATGEPQATTAALHRLQSAGMRRHPALHLLAEALASELISTMAHGQEFREEAWTQRLSTLEPADWIARQMRRDLSEPPPG